MYSGDKELSGSRHKDFRNNNEYFEVSHNNKSKWGLGKNGKCMQLSIGVDGGRELQTQ